MEQNKALSTVEQNALQVSYEICGTSVQLDIDFVKKYLRNSIRWQTEKFISSSTAKTSLRRWL